MFGALPPGQLTLPGAYFGNHMLVDMTKGTKPGTGSA